MNNAQTESAAVQDANIVVALVVLALFVAVIVLVRRGRRDPVNNELPRGQRARPIALEWVEPWLDLVVVVVVLWAELTSGWAHVMAAIIGVILGAPIGYVRARTMFVGAVPERNLVIMRRSGLEYVLLAFLLGVNIASHYLTADTTSVFSLILTALIALLVGEAFVRSASMTVRYRRWSASAARRGATEDSQQPS
ncbi:MAG: hypothetical protein KDC39_15895 [Actinobacteria bacterium]|nr:hypothetical protein [Actinomycetota bacterium]